MIHNIRANREKLHNTQIREVRGDIPKSTHNTNMEKGIVLMVNSSGSKERQRGTSYHNKQERGKRGMV